MAEFDVVAIALCMASPFPAVAGLLNGLLWRIHFALGGIATVAIVCFLAIGLMPLMLVPTLAAAVIWTTIGSAIARRFFGRSRQTQERTAARKDRIAGAGVATGHPA